jgi:hypothetical protein
MGPFVKLSFYATMSGTLHSMFVVREIDNVQDRNLVHWWFITFNHLARFASWVAQGGGRNMAGGGSTVVKIPRQEFQHLNARLSPRCREGRAAITETKIADQVPRT